MGQRPDRGGGGGRCRTHTFGPEHRPPRPAGPAPGRRLMWTRRSTQHGRGYRMHRILGVIAAGLALLAIVPAANAAQQRSDAPSQWQTSADAQWKPHLGFDSQHGLYTFSDAGVLTGSEDSYGEIDMLKPPAT